MNNLFFWIAIGLLGLLLYISPGYFVYRMYESFTEKPQSVNTVDTSGAAQVVLAPAKPPKNEPKSIQNLLELLNTTPPLKSPTEITPTPQSNSGNSIPIEYDTMRSRPEGANVALAESEALKQGDLYKSSLPLNPVPGTQGMIGSMGTQPRSVPAGMYQPREAPARNYNPQVGNPNCPDMRDYIRKDSIPCWGCKLS